MASRVSVSPDAPAAAAAAVASRIDELKEMTHVDSCLNKDKNITFQACDCKWCGNILVQPECTIDISISLAEKICKDPTYVDSMKLPVSKSLEEHNERIARIKSMAADYKIYHWMESEDGIVKPPGLCPCCWYGLYR